MDRLSQSNFGKRYATAATRHSTLQPTPRPLVTERCGWRPCADAYQAEAAAQSDERAGGGVRGGRLLGGGGEEDQEGFRLAGHPAAALDQWRRHAGTAAPRRAPQHAQLQRLRQPAAPRLARACTRCALTRRACSTCRPNQRSRRTRPLAAVLTRAAAQDMLRDEFGIGQLGKRLKVLEAARAEFAKQPKSRRKSAARAPAPAPAPEPAQAVSTLRKRKGEDSSQAVAEPAPETTTLSPPDRRSMQQKIMDPKTVQEINEMRSWTVQFADFVSRTLGGARDVVTVGTILLALVYYAALVTDSLPDGWV